MKSKLELACLYVYCSLAVLGLVVYQEWGLCDVVLALSLLHLAFLFTAACACHHNYTLTRNYSQTQLNQLQPHLFSPQRLFFSASTQFCWRRLTSWYIETTCARHAICLSFDVSDRSIIFTPHKQALGIITSSRNRLATCTENKAG